LIENTSSVQHRALIAVTYDTGARLSEIRNMNLSDIQYDNKSAFAIIDGKTGKRPVRFVHSLKYLSNWIDYHQLKDLSGIKGGNTFTRLKKECIENGLIEIVDITTITSRNEIIRLGINFLGNRCEVYRFIKFDS
jgi:integrase